MADTRVVIDVDINTSAAAQGLRDLQQRFNAFTGALNKNNAIQATASRQYADQLMNLVNSGQFFTAEMVKMQTAAGRLDKTLAKGQATMGQFFSARFLRNSNAAAQVLSLANARAAALQTQFVATAASANGMRDAIAIRPYEAFNSALAVSTQKLAIHRAMLMQATTHMINFGKNTQWAGRQLMVGFTVPLTIFGGVAGKVFRELEEQAINFKKVYGDIFTTEAETEQALDAVRELSMEFTKYGIAVKDTMALAGVAAQSGLRNAELMAATTQATRLATLGQMEQAEAMKTIISLQTAFKSSNEDLAESVDFLNIIENQTVLSLQDVAGAIPRVAPVIQGLGGDVKDLAVLLVAMKEGGVTAGEGANALKSSLGRLIVPTRQAKEMAAEFGISLEQIVENNRGQLIPMIMELGRALEGVGDLERQQLLSTIFGKFQYARIGALFDNITKDSSQAARAMDLMGLSAQQLGEIAEKELSVVEQSVGAKFTAAMERAKVAIAPLGEAFLSLSIPIINFFAQLIEKFNALPDFAKKFAVFGSVLVGVVIPVGTMFLGLLMNLIGTLIKFGAIIGIAFKGFTSGGIRGAIEAVSQALNYMSLEEIDAANAAQQLGQSTQIVNAAFRDQVGDATAATVAIEALGLQYAELIIRMREAAALSGAMGPFAVPGTAMGRAAGAQRAAQAVRRNKGGPIPFSTGDTVPGVGNRDTVPAILTPGEFVVNKRASAENRGLLEAINSGDIQKLNKGGGVASPGRIFYGTPPAQVARSIASSLGLGADDLLAKAEVARKKIGSTNVSDDAQRARAATGRLGVFSVTQSRFLQLVGNVLSRKTGVARAVSALLGMGVDVTASARGNVGFFSKFNQQLRDRGKAGVRAGDLLDELTTTKGAFTPIREQVKTWNRLNSSKTVDAQEIIDDFIASLRNLNPETRIWDTQVKSLYRGAFKGKDAKALLTELDRPYVLDTSGLKGLIEPALKNANYRQVTLNSPDKTESVKMRMRRGVLTAQHKDKDGKILRTETVSLKKGEYIQDGSNPPNIYMLDDDGVLINLRSAIGELGHSTLRQNPYGYKSRSIRDSKPDGAQFAHANKGGMIQGFNQGNIVPGVGRTDTVPAMLTPGEFVVNKDATRRNLDTLKAINNGTIAGFNAGGAAGATNMGPFIPYNPNSGVPPQFPMTGPSSPIKVDIAEVSDRDTAAANKKAIGGMGGKAMLAQMGIGTLLSIPGMFAGQAAGQAVGGDTGAMIGGMAGSMLPFFLPYGKIGAGLKGMFAGKAKNAVGAVDDAPIGNQLWNTIGKQQKPPAAVSNVANVAKVARFAPLLLNPWTAAIVAAVAAMTAVVVTLKKMKDSNEAEYEAGRKLADAMTTSSSEIEELGQSAKQRAKDMESFLNAPEAQGVIDKYQKQIAKAGTAAEKEALIRERDAEVRKFSSRSRKEGLQDFYTARIREANVAGASRNELRNLYQQRSMTMGLENQRADFDLDTTYGSQFLQNQGKEVFEQFESVRNMVAERERGAVSQAQVRTFMQMSDAAYNMSMSVEKIAERDLAGKLAQYIMSGVMTEQQAASVAEAVGTELGDLRIGKSIREELRGIVGVDAYRARYTPGQLALQFAEQDERRIKSLTESTYRTMGELITQDPGRDIAAPMIGYGLAGPIGGAAGWAMGNPRGRNELTPGETGYFNIFNQFFSGMADQARRNIGAVIELQGTQHQMLEENMAATMLAYNELIAKADTVAEMERLKLEKSIYLTKLQEKIDDAREKRLEFIYGDAVRREIINRPSREARERVEARELDTAASRQRLREMEAPADIWGILAQLPDKIAFGLDLGISNFQNGVERVFSNVFGKTRDFLPGSMAQLYSEQSIEAIRTQLEGTALQPQFELFLANLDIAGENLSPEFAAVLSEMVADPEVRDAIVIGMNSAFEKAAVGVETGAMGDILAEKIKQEIRNMIIDIESIEGLPTEVVEGLMTAIPQMRAEEMGAIFESMFTLKGAYGIEYYNQVLERFLPLFVKFGEVSTLATSALGGKSLIETVLGDFDIRERLGQDDEAFQDVMRFLTWVSEFDSELQFEFINEKDIDAMIEFGKELERFDPKEFNSNVKSIKKELKGGIFPEEMQEQTDYLIATLNLLNEIEDPEIKARLSADIDETVREALSIIQQMGGATSAAELEDMRGQVFDLLSGVGGKITAAQVESEEKSKPSGSGGAKDDPLGDLMRDLRDTIQNQASIGEKITATGQTAKAIYANLRSMNVDETIIDYLRSMSPEQALEVGQQLLKDRRKLNTLMALIAQETVTAVRDQAEQAEVQRRFTLKLSDSRVMDGLSVIRGMELMDDPQFIEDMRKASQGPKPQKAMREVRNAYLKQRREQEIQMSRMAPDLIQRDIAESQIEQRATQQLSSQGLNQQQIEAALGNEAIMTRIRSRFARGKNIGAEVIDMAKDYASAQRTIFDEINDSVDNIQEAFSNVNGILSAASDRIEQFNIKPLEDQMEAISESTAELSEQQRRLSNSLNDIQDQESDLRDEQKDKEESINTYYNDRIESLEKVAKINEQIAQQQEGQVDLAGALSRGDIAAAAKAANDMRNKAAAARQQQNIDNLRRQQEEEIEKVREETEQKIKDLVVEVNGELLTREDIEDKIKSIQDDIYENSLLEYDLQQKITLERKKQSEIAEAQNRLNRGQNLINRIANLQSIEGRTPEETEAKRRSTIDLIKAEASVLGGPAAENLIKFLDNNVNSLVQGKWSQEFINSLTGGLTSFSTDFVADFDNMLKTGLTIPVLDLSPDGERPEAKPFTPEDFEAMLPDIDFSAAFSSASVALNATIDAMDSKNKEWNDEIVSKNPFDTLISGTKRFKRVIDGAFASIPRKPGSGGGSKKKPDTTLPEEYFDYDPMGPPITTPYRQPADSYREDESYLNDGWPWQPDKAKGIADRAVSGIIGYMIGGLPGAIFNSTFGADFTTNAVTSIRTFLQSEKTMEDLKQLGKDIVGGENGGIVAGVLTGFRFGLVPALVVGALVNKFKDIFHSQSPSQHPDIISIGKDLVGNLDGGIIGGIYQMFKNSLPGQLLTSLITSFKTLFGLNEGSSQDGGILGIGKSIIGDSEGGIIGGLLNRIQNFPGVSLVTGLVERFRSIFSIEEGKSSDSGILGIGKGIIGGVFGAIGTFLSENTPLGLIGSLVTRLLGEFGITDKKGGGKESTDEGILGIGKGILGGIIGGFAADLDVPGVWSATVEKVRSTLSTAFDNVQNTFKSIGETISGWIRGPIEAALNWARSQRAGDGQPNFFGGPIKRAFGGNINYRPPTTAPPGMMFGGKMKKFAMGSFVPGIGNTDTVPALLTPGEFVVRKSVAQTYGPLLNALNSDVFPKMTMTSLMPSSSKTSSDGQVSYNYAINVNVSGSNASPDDIANTVMSKIKMMESRNIRGTRIG